MVRLHSGALHFVQRKRLKQSILIVESLPRGVYDQGRVDSSGSWRESRIPLKWRDVLMVRKLVSNPVLSGGVQERFNCLVSKTMRGESLTRVQISPPPLSYGTTLALSAQAGRLNFLSFRLFCLMQEHHNNSMKFEFSAGGIVFKKENETIFVLLAQHSQHHGWVFPKGLIGDKSDNKKESKEETAIREVREETGIVASIVGELPKVEFWYVFEGEKRKKTVYYYIMKYKEGSTSEHDFEMEKVEWLPLEQVSERLTYNTDKQTFEKAKATIISLAN